MTESPTPAKAKAIIAAKMAALGLPALRLSAKTIDFSDLARASCVFVKVHDWTPDPRMGDLQTEARANGFRVQAEGGF